MLKIRIYSFGFKKSGIPVDSSLNGGGFVFDCRFIYNPGRIKEFSEQTGRDSGVINFLDNQPEMIGFLNNSFSIIKPAVENFLERDFTNLMVSYGCTGGQHRSVYAAEKLKEFLSAEFSGRVSLEIKHTEFPNLQ